MSDLPPIEYQRAEPRKPSSRGWVFWVVFTGVVCLAVAVILPSLPRRKYPVDRVRCAVNLRSIGQAMELYASDYGGAIPPDLQAVATAEDLGLEILICPKSKDRPAPTTQAIGAGGACSYLYVGTGVTNRGNPNQIAMVEDPANHNLEGGNVLFGDGHVEFVDLPTMQLFLNELSTGYNPPRTTTPSMSEAAARQDYEKNWKARMPQLKTGVWRIPTTQAVSKPE